MQSYAVLIEIAGRSADTVGVLVIAFGAYSRLSD